MHGNDLLKKTDNLFTDNMQKRIITNMLTFIHNVPVELCNCKETRKNIY